MADLMTLDLYQAVTLLNNKVVLSTILVIINVLNQIRSYSTLISEN